MAMAAAMAMVAAMAVAAAKFDGLAGGRTATAAPTKIDKAAACRRPQVVLFRFASFCFVVVLFQ